MRKKIMRMNNSLNAYDNNLYTNEKKFYSKAEN